jgi:hypothetical protein
LLDKRFGTPVGVYTQTQSSTEPPICPTHNRPMKQMKYPTKQGHAWHCTAKVSDGWCEERA